ncbi:MAG: putative rane protein [Mycobacterium sp.]|nr:putative rane protein [Mycobacterium sp.]
MRELDYRFTLANERTFLAWIRTALALLAGGVAVVQLVPALSIPGIRHGLGTALTAAGGVLAVLAVRRWQNVQIAMRRGVELPRSWMPVLLACVVVAVTVALIVVIAVQP